MPPSPSAFSLYAAATMTAIVAVLLAASFCGTPVPGVNEPHYLSKARATADPQWCVNDFFLQSENAHAVFFAIVGPFAKALPFTKVLAAGRIISLLLVAVGLYSLCAAVGCDARRSVISAGLFYLIGLTGNFSGEWVIGGFESKVPAYGFAFLALATCIRNRIHSAFGGYIFAGIFCGLAVALHPVVGVWTAISISMTEVWLWLWPGRFDVRDGRGLFSLLCRGAIFGLTSLVCALPGLIPALVMLLSSDVDLATKQNAKQIQVFYRLAHHLDPTQFSFYSWCHTAALIAVLTITVVWIRTWNSRSDGEDSNDQQQNNGNNRFSDSEAYLLKFLACTAVIAGVGVAVGWHDKPMNELASRHWRAALLQFYPFRLFDAFLPLTTAIFLSAVPVAFGNFVLNRDTKTVANQATIARQSWNPFRSIAVTAMIMVIACGTAAAIKRPSSPSGYNMAVFADWKKACAWLKENTAEDSLIFAPRESCALKLFAERAEYVAFKDCPQNAAGILEWNRRLWKLHRWSQQSYRDQVFDKVDLAKLKQQMGIDYVLTRRLGPFSEQPVWKGESWRIFSTVTRQSEADGQSAANTEAQSEGENE